MADRPRVVMVHDYPPFTGGGLALSVLALADLMSETFDVEVVSSRAADHFGDDRDAASRPGVSVRSVWAGLSVARRADVLMVHWTFSFRRLSTLALALPRRPRPTVCVIHTAPDHLVYNRLRRLPTRAKAALVRAVARRLTSRGDTVVALSQAHAAALRNVGIPAAAVLPVAVAPAPVGPAPVERRQRPSRRVGIAGELSTLKGADLIPPLLPLLAARYEVRITAAGPLTGSIRAAAARLPDAQRRRVWIEGPLPPAAMDRFYREIDYLLVLSRTESQCRVALEAMLRDVIVVACPAGGVVDLVHDGVTGFLLDRRDPHTVLRRLAEIDAALDLAAAVRAEARAFAQAHQADSAEGCKRFAEALADSVTARRPAQRLAGRGDAVRVPPAGRGSRPPACTP